VCGNGGTGGNGGHVRHAGGTGGNAFIILAADSVSITDSIICLFSGNGSVATGSGGSANGGGRLFPGFPNDIETRPHANGGSSSVKAGASGLDGIGGDGGLAKAGGNAGSGGNGGRIQDFAGSGGNISLQIATKTVLIYGSLLYCNSGQGRGYTSTGGSAKGGDGGSANGGKGSGSYAGGDGGTAGSGGSGGSGGDGGNLIGSSANGGWINVHISSNYGHIYDSSFQLKGGSGNYSAGIGNSNVLGGAGGSANGGSGTPSGTAGTAGTTGTAGTPGVAGTCSDQAGNGGDINLKLTISKPTITSTTNLILTSGNGRSIGQIKKHIPMSVPILLYPDNNLKTNTLTSPTFEWTKLLDSTTNGDLAFYEFQIDDNEDFSSNYDSYSGIISFYKLPKQLPDGIYYWRVRALYQNPAGISPGWSKAFKLTVDTTPVTYSCQRPEVNLWSNMSLIECSINISDNVSGVACDSIRYCTSTNGINGLNNWLPINMTGEQEEVKCSVQPMFDEGVNNYIKWQAKDCIGNGPTESEPFQLMIDITPPSLNIISPLNDQSFHDSLMEFHWSAEDQLSGLNGNAQLQLATDEDFNNLTYDLSIEIGTKNKKEYSFTLTQPLQNDKYFWRMRISDNATNWCDFTASRVCYVDLELPTSLIIGPSNDIWQHSTKPTLKWQAIDEVSGLTNITQLQIATDKEFDSTSIIFDSIIKYPGVKLDNRSGRTLKTEFNSPRSSIYNTLEYEYTLIETLQDGEYYWRVRAQDNTLSWGYYSEPKALRIDMQAPYVLLTGLIITAGINVNPY
jgi:hypothetical protein